MIEYDKKIFKSLVFSLMLSAPLSYAQNNFKALNFNDAFTIVKGTGARKIALFSDPHCPYSKSFEAQLSNVSNIGYSDYRVDFIENSI